jgi:8-oxo-dGTP diphosphatase
VSELVQVSAAVIERPDGSFLMASRPVGKVYAGWWEFPGGKVEPGETPHHALVRELREELGLETRRAYPWVVREYAYPHAHVRLHFFRVVDWQGEPHPHEGQTLAWTRAQAPGVAPILPANGPILKGLSLPLEYGISDAAGLGEAVFLERLQRALAGGLGLLQLREKTWPAESWPGLAERVAALCHAHGARLFINSDLPQALDLARTLGAGLHLTGASLMALTQRPALEWVGASCHDAAELAQAARLELDYALLAPVLPTATHPGAAPLGWDGFASLAAGRPMPIYALGGLHRADLEMARAHGAHGIAMKGALWRAPPA